ncbi:MAG TPA: DUF6152 family protein [Terriglobia bacterium]|nr:DUF6152 family protein [Terriglobia bacterium]
MKELLRSKAGPAAIALCLIVGFVSVALAHHSFSPFNMTESKVLLNATVKKIEWTNPHTWFWFDVPDGKGGTELWGAEGMSPNYLDRRGWSRNRLKLGDKLELTIHPMKNGDKAGMWMTAKRPNGEVLVMGGTITDP